MAREMPVWFALYAIFVWLVVPPWWSLLLLFFVVFAALQRSDRPANGRRSGGHPIGWLRSHT
jgi:hypothetical protein